MYRYSEFDEAFVRNRVSEFRGQEHLLGEGRAVRAMLDAGRVSSMILWGPPGSGKTTLARLLPAGYRGELCGYELLPAPGDDDGLIGLASLRFLRPGGPVTLP